MTSEEPTECFVYITLPGQTEPVTAGRFLLSTDRRGVPEGRFVYGRSYLERPNALALDPVELKMAPRTYATAGLGGVFGALRDASPDYWGRRVIQRHLGKAQPSEMEYLLFSPDDRAGALGFGLNQTPPAPKRTFNQTLELAKAAGASRMRDRRGCSARMVSVLVLVLVIMMMIILMPMIMIRSRS